jgi:hypothetical protein
MVVDADAIEARVLAAGNERGQLGQGPPHRHAEVDAEAGQSPGKTVHVPRS